MSSSFQHRSLGPDEALQLAVRSDNGGPEGGKTLSGKTETDRLGSNGRKRTRKLPGDGHSDRLVEGGLEHGSSPVTVWGGMPRDGTESSRRMDGRMDGSRAPRFSEEGSALGIKLLHDPPSQVTFQQGTEPKHTHKQAEGMAQKQRHLRLATVSAVS